MEAGSPSSCAACTCPGPQIIPGTRQPCPSGVSPGMLWSTGRWGAAGREGRAPTYQQLHAAAGSTRGSRRGEEEDPAGSRLQHECQPSGSSPSFKHPLVSHRRGQCRPAGRGSPTLGASWGAAFKLKGYSWTAFENKFLLSPSPPRPSPSSDWCSVSAVVLKREVFCDFSETLSD